jgi:hypothetical protein
VRLAALLLVLALVAVTYAEDRDEEPGGLSTRLQAIDEAAQLEADHPARAGEEPAEAAEDEEEPPDPTVAPADQAAPAEQPAPARRATSATHRRSGTAAARSLPLAPSGGSAGSPLESPLRTSPLAPPRDADDDS